MSEKSTLEEKLVNVLYELRDSIRGKKIDPDRDFFNYAVNFLDITKSQCFQDVWVLWETLKRGRSKGFFVEFGAWNGIDDSNTYSLQFYHKWEGILAEPIPGMKEVIHKFRDNGKVHISGEAVTDSTGDEVDFFVSAVKNLSALDEYKTLDYNAVKRVQEGELVKVKTITLFDLLEKYKAPVEVDYISVDTEGNELSLLRKFFKDNKNKYVVHTWTVEHNYNPNTIRELYDLFVSNGYERVHTRLSQWDGFWRLKHG